MDQPEAYGIALLFTFFLLGLGSIAIGPLVSH
jgi:hypothetical protein